MSQLHKMRFAFWYLIGWMPLIVFGNTITWQEGGVTLADESCTETGYRRGDRGIYTFQYGAFRINVAASSGLPDGYLYIYYSRNSNDPVGSWDTYFISFVQDGVPYVSGATFDYAYPFQSWWAPYSLCSTYSEDDCPAQIGSAETTYTVTAATLYSYGGGTYELTLSGNELVISGVAGTSTCNSAATYGSVLYEPMYLVLGGTYTPPTNVVGHFWFSVDSDCLRDRSLQLIVGDDVVQTLEIPAGYFSDGLEYEGEVPIGATFRYQVIDGEHTIQVSSGIVIPEHLGGVEIGSDFYDEDRFLQMHCDPPSPTPTPTPTPGGTATATPTGTPSPTPTATAGGGSTPTPTPGGGGGDGSPFPTPEPLTTSTPVFSATPEIGDSPSNVGTAIHDGTEGVEDGLNGLSGSASCWQSASFGSVSTLPIDIGALGPGYAAAYGHSIAVPDWAPLVRTVILFVISCCWFVVAYKSVVGLREGT